MTTQQKQNVQKEFDEFMQMDTSRFDSPKEFFKKLKSRLFPNPWFVFLKVALVHLVFGLMSLSVCRQFGLNPFGTDFSLSNWFMKIGGHPFCMSLCGVVFMGSTYVFSNLFLTLEEFESVKRHKWLQTSIFGLASLAIFYFFGAQLVISVTLLWLLGALIGGVVCVELSYWVRRSLLKLRIA